MVHPTSRTYAWPSSACTKSPLSHIRGVQLQRHDPVPNDFVEVGRLVKASHSFSIYIPTYTFRKVCFEEAVQWLHVIMVRAHLGCSVETAYEWIWSLYDELPLQISKKFGPFRGGSAPTSSSKSRQGSFYGEPPICSLSSYFLLHHQRGLFKRRSA